MFPPDLRLLADLLPFRGLLQIPADVYLREGAASDTGRLLAVQAVWAAGLLLLGRRVTDRAVRKRVVQGG